MTYALTINIAEDSAADRNIKRIAKAEHISQEEAALTLIAGGAQKRPASADARRILGAFKEDAALMDEVVELAMDERQRRNSRVSDILCKRVE